ncbi:MAG: exosome complex exonuclease Rrp41 [Candidatus Woesearchaeota archaeon]
MAYTKRISGRKMDETRPISAKAGVIKKADGSGMFKIGGTTAYAAVYGPRELFPRNQQDPRQGILRCSYNMLPFAGPGERGRPGPNRRSKEISMVTTHALRPVLNLEDYPNAVVDVYIELTETDAGSRCAGICAASIALADAGLMMKDMVAAIAMGHVGDQLIVDVDGPEEHIEEVKCTDIPIAMVPSTGEVTLLQMDGPIKDEQLYNAIEKARPVIERIVQVQRDALKARFKGDSK